MSFGVFSFRFVRITLSIRNRSELKSIPPILNVTPNNLFNFSRLTKFFVGNFRAFENWKRMSNGIMGTYDMRVNFLLEPFKVRISKRRDTYFALLREIR